MPDHSETWISRAELPPEGVIVTVLAPPLQTGTYQTYMVTSWAGSVTGPNAVEYVLPKVSETVMVPAGRAAVPVTIKKFPAVLLEANVTDMLLVALSLPFTFFCLRVIGPDAAGLTVNVKFCVALG